MPTRTRSMPADPKFAAALRKLMGDTTVAELARRAGLSADAVGLYLAGVRDPTLTAFRKLCRGLGVEPGDFIARLAPLKPTGYVPGSARKRGREPKGAAQPEPAAGDTNPSATIPEAGPTRRKRGPK